MIKKITNTISIAVPHINIDGLNERFSHVCIFDSNQQANDKKPLRFSKLIAIGAHYELTVRETQSGLEQLQKFYDSRKGWLFGYITYDLKNEIEQLESQNDDHLKFPLLHFFSPKIVIQVSESNTTLFYDDELISEMEVNEIYEFTLSEKQHKKGKSDKLTIQSKITKEQYIKAVTGLKQHIGRGDIYEVNFCQEFFATNCNINPVEIYENLNAISEAPFSAFAKFNMHYLLCSSPERFLQKHNNKLISQPIKGTAKRSENKQEDEQLKIGLKNNLKERSENVMIVDLVRNDLSRIAKRGTVNVEELQVVYSYKQVHQMISTVSCELKENTSFINILKSTFPMGSMTGAPKVSAMKLIEEFESTKRGLYSGTIGYIFPDGDFDFNVIIRSILYNSENKYLSFMVGSAITDQADPESEYEECMLKAKAMFEATKY